MPCMHAGFWAIIVYHSLQLPQPCTTDLLVSNYLNVFSPGFRSRNLKSMYHLGAMFSLKPKREGHAFPGFAAARGTCFPCPVGTTHFCLPLSYRVFSYLSVSVSSHSVLPSEHLCPHSSLHVRASVTGPTLF